MDGVFRSIRHGPHRVTDRHFSAEPTRSLPPSSAKRRAWLLRDSNYQQHRWEMCTLHEINMENSWNIMEFSIWQRNHTDMFDNDRGPSHWTYFNELQPWHAWSFHRDQPLGIDEGIRIIFWPCTACFIVHTYDCFEGIKVPTHWLQKKSVVSYCCIYLGWLGPTWQIWQTQYKLQAISSKSSAMVYACFWLIEFNRIHGISTKYSPTISHIIPLYHPWFAEICPKKVLVSPVRTVSGYEDIILAPLGGIIFSSMGSPMDHFSVANWRAKTG